MNTIPCQTCSEHDCRKSILSCQKAIDFMEANNRKARLALVQRQAPPPPPPAPQPKFGLPDDYKLIGFDK